MKRVVHKALSFEDAEEWNVQQQVEMTPQERMAAARELNERVYGTETKDVRESGIYHRFIKIFSGRSGSPTTPS